MQDKNIRNMVLCALFAALTAICSQLVIPIGPVPINLATFVVFAAGAVLGSRLGAVSMAGWALMGTLGVPVFTMLRSGPGVLLGPTGGYIVGYIPAAFLTGLLVETFNQDNKSLPYLLAMAVGMITYFGLGTAWYVYSTNTPLLQALMVCVVPFLPGDFLKAGLATVVAKRLRPAVQLPAAG